LIAVNVDVACVKVANVIDDVVIIFDCIGLRGWFWHWVRAKEGVVVELAIGLNGSESTKGIFAGAGGDEVEEVGKNMGGEIADHPGYGYHAA